MTMWTSGYALGSRESCPGRTFNLSSSLGLHWDDEPVYSTSVPFLASTGGATITIVCKVTALSKRNFSNLISNLPPLKLLTLITFRLLKMTSGCFFKESNIKNSGPISEWSSRYLGSCKFCRFVHYHTPKNWGTKRTKKRLTRMKSFSRMGDGQSWKKVKFNHIIYQKLQLLQVLQLD